MKTKVKKKKVSGPVLIEKDVEVEVIHDGINSSLCHLFMKLEGETMKWVYQGYEMAASGSQHERKERNEPVYLREW